MPLRKRLNKDHSRGFLCKSQQEVSKTQEEDTTPDDKDELSVSMLTSPAVRGKQRREREDKLKSKEMTEEEMMDMALRLSKEEANITAIKLQKEEEAMKRAIQDSMMSECSQSQSLIASTRRKLTYSNGESQTGSSRLTIDTDCTQELSRGPKTKGVEMKRRLKKLEGSPLTEMPDLSQPSLSSSDSVPVGSPQSCDSTQIKEDGELPKSPIFPSSSRQVSVQVPRLSQNLVNSCKASGFVLCSPDSCVVTQNSQVYPLTCSPTFPKSPTPRTQTPAPTKTSASQTVHLRDDTEPDLSPVLCAVFGKKAQTDDRSRALKTETSKTSALMFSSQESSTSVCLGKDTDFPKSPVFSEEEQERDGPDKSRCCKSPVFGTNGRKVKTSESTLGEQNCSQSQYLSQSSEDNPDDPTVMLKPDDDAEAKNTTKLSETELTSDMTLRWSEEDDDNYVTPVASPSPVFPDETPVHETSDQTQTNGSVNPPQSQSGAGTEMPSFAGDSGPQTTVHYYWGVPFCPRGLDPDAYTKVIVAQMEVYEKSLKRAQRRLGRKVKWGEPVLPQPERSPSPECDSPRIHLSQRRSLRRKANLHKNHSPQTDEERAEMDEETQRDKEEEELKQRDQNEEQQQKKDRTRDEEQESDCEVCPETQLSDNDSTQDLTQPTQLPVKSPEMVRGDEPQRSENEEEMEVDVEQDPNDPKEPHQSKPADADTGGQFLESQPSQDPDLEPVAAVLRPQSLVQCPICQRTFPSADIEMHAAFCDGEPAAGDPASPRLKRKKTRRAETEKTEAEKTEPNQERCYICHRAVPLKEYSRHTEHCLHRRVPRTATTGGLLSALDQSERRDLEAGPSGSRVRSEDVIDLRDEDDDEASAIQISHSPIRSFTPISEAADCLIDFRKQHRAKKHGLKRR